MATRGFVGYIDEEGNYKAIYNTMDSYPSGLLRGVKNWIVKHGPKAFSLLIDKCADKNEYFDTFPEISYDEYSQDNFIEGDNPSDISIWGFDAQYYYLFDKETGALVDANGPGGSLMDVAVAADSLGFIVRYFG